MYVKIHFVVFGYMLRVTYAPPEPLVEKFYHQNVTAVCPLQPSLTLPQPLTTRDVSHPGPFAFLRAPSIHTMCSLWTGFSHLAKCN